MSLMGSTCMMCQKPLEVKERQENGVRKSTLHCPRCKYEVAELTNFSDVKNWSKEQAAHDKKKCN